MGKIDRVLKYIDGQMSDEEKSAFEKELASSAELNSKMEEYKNFFSEIKEIKEIPVDASYFVNMIPNFRNRIELKKKKKIFPKLALGFSTLTAVIIISLFLFKQPKNVTFVNLNSHGIDSTLSLLQVGISPLQDNFNFSNLSKEEEMKYDSVVTSMLSNELNLSSAGLNYINETGSNSDLQSLLQGVNDVEANKIYNELLHKKIF
jgi:hypothetical protein